MFNASEYMHLAMHASARGDRFAALGFLKEALSAEPKNAMAHYLVAVECAELGMNERAIRGMEEALALDPSIDPVRFQLSMLYWQSGQAASAQKHLTQLSRGTDAELRAYSEAILAIIANDPEKAKERLVAGLGLAGSNQTLKQNMHNLYQRLVALAPPSGPQAPQAKPASEAPREPQQSVVLPAAYEHLRLAQ
jgi:tetratricopeptide (TPR) repeat protein